MKYLILGNEIWFHMNLLPIWIEHPSIISHKTKIIWLIYGPPKGTSCLPYFLPLSLKFLFFPFSGQFHASQLMSISCYTFSSFKKTISQLLLFLFKKKLNITQLPLFFSFVYQITPFSKRNLNIIQN